MKKIIFNLGRTLNITEQKLINGGIKDIGFPCILPQLAPPPEGCSWIKTGLCTYELICDDIALM